MSFINKTIKKKDLSQILFFVFLILPFFKINYLVNRFPIVGTLYNVLCLVDLFLMVMIIVFNSRKVSKIIIYIFIFFILYNITNIINNSNVREGLFITLYGITACLITDYGIHKNSFNFLSALMFYLSFLIFINFLSILLYPNGILLNPNAYFNKYGWILGYKNGLIIYIIPAILSSFVVSLKKYNHLRKFDYFLLLISYISVIMANSSTSIISLSIIVFYTLFYKRFTRIKAMNIKTYCLTSLILNFLIVIVRIQNVFKRLIVDGLHKNLTFTGRTYIWDYYLKSSFDKPIFGHGTQDSMYRALLIKNASGAVHCHNQLLEVFYQVGILGFIIYMYIHVISVIKLYKYRDNTFISQFISILLFACFITMITEVFSFNSFLYILVIAYNIDVILDMKVA